MQLTDRRVVLVRELSRAELRRAAGLDDGQTRISSRLYAGERLRVITELRRAAAYGTTMAMQRYRESGVPHAAGKTGSLKRPAA